MDAKKGGFIMACSNLPMAGSKHTPDFWGLFSDQVRIDIDIHNSIWFGCLDFEPRQYEFDLNIVCIPFYISYKGQVICRCCFFLD